MTADLTSLQKMTQRGKKVLRKWKSDSAIQLGESCRSDIPSDIDGFKEPVEECVGMEKKEHMILQIDADAPQTQGVAAQNSCSNSWRECESGSDILLNAVEFIVVVPAVIFFLHLFEVF